MLESFLNFNQIVKRPYIMFFWSFLISTFGFALSNMLSFKFRIAGSSANLSGIFSIIFIIIPSAYIFTTFLKREEYLEEKYISKNKNIWKLYTADIAVLLMFFAGTVFSFSFWSFVMPADFFEIQKAELGRITSGTSGYATSSGLGFREVLTNNIFVMFLSFVLSLIFGSGVVFILVWNAGLLGVRIGQLSSGVTDLFSKSLPFLPHGIFEITSFILAGLAGGLLSAAIIRKHHKKKVFETIFLNSAILLAVAFVLFAIGAWIEVN